MGQGFFDGLKQSERIVFEPKVYVTLGVTTLIFESGFEFFQKAFYAIPCQGRDGNDGIKDLELTIGVYDGQKRLLGTHVDFVDDE